MIFEMHYYYCLTYIVSIISKYTHARRKLQIYRRVWRSCLIIETESSKNPTTCSTRYTRTAVLYDGCTFRVY